MDRFLAPRLRRRLFGAGASEIAVRAEPLGGGLEASAVHLVTVEDRRHRMRHRFVRKVATGMSAREADVYRSLVHAHGLAFAPRVLDIESPAHDTAILCIEAVEPTRRWPWADMRSSAAVLEHIATLHELRDPHPLPRWDYDAELAASAERTVSLVRALACRRDTSALVRRAVRPLEALAGQLASVRRELFASRAFGACVIHGDLHPGNVLERGHGEPVLIDWARARIGSGLEDVSSWLQSLAYWELEARRRHDTLFVRYLVARGLPGRLTGEIRDLYWLAAACNAFAGALAYHVLVASESPDRAAAERSARCARDWIRIVRRARASLH